MRITRRVADEPQIAAGMPMNDTCDRCGPAVRAVYRAHRRGELYLCTHCASELWSALSAQGWTIGPVNELAPAPQAALRSRAQTGQTSRFRDAAPRYAAQLVSAMAR
jgi:hypothetical protein